MDDMSKKLPNVGSGAMIQSMSVPTHMQAIPYRLNPPRYQHCNKLVSCCKDPKPQFEDTPAKMMMHRPTMSSTSSIGFTQIAPKPQYQGDIGAMGHRNQEPMVCRNCKKTINCCNYPQPKMPDYGSQFAQQ
ncbi:hypothetical protein Ddc_16759 [Ditylenchus destructor]|nr:hypothetical protein Ddc_16759 [Ditylenchus destructor]